MVTRRRFVLFGATGVAGAAAMLLSGLAPTGVAALRSAAQVERARIIPAPTTDVRAGDAKNDVAVFAGGCFWGVQGVFQHTKGVKNAVSGYAGGQKRTANYEAVGGGDTGHAESVRVTFDPRKVTYGQLLHVFFSVAHNPTELNRQGPDVGTQYRSAIFPMSEEQARVARAYIAQLNTARAFDAAIVTTIELDRPFYDAEPYHQDFLSRNPTHRYIVVNDLPKIDELKRVFPDLYRSRPVLVGGTQ
jgi:peptide-methionine (S)-S-oxide reductase